MIERRSFITGLIALVAAPAIALASSAVAGDGDPVGMVIHYAGDIEPHNGLWKWADGSCVEDARYPALSRAIHDGDNWPYGRCDETHFRLPDLRSNIKAARYLIRVR